MTSTRKIALFHAALAVLAVHHHVLAATPRENSLAAVAVARARVQLAQRRAELTDSTNHFVNPPTSLPDDESSAKPSEQVVKSVRRTQQLEAELAEMEKLLASARHRPEERHNAIVLSTMRFEPAANGEPYSPTPPRAQLVVEYTDGCPPCRRLKHEIKDILVPLGWEVGESEEAQIRFVHSSEETTYPRITLYQNGRMVDRWYGYQDPGSLSQRLRSAWDQALEPIQTAASHGSAGTIYARPQIGQAIAYLRDYIGDGKTITIGFDHSEARLNLLAAQPLELKQIIGMSGRLQVDAPDAVRLPVKNMAVNYRLINKDIALVAEEFKVIGFADLFKAEPVNAPLAAQQPVQLAVIDDSLLIYSISQMLYAVFQLLHPTVDFVIPEQVICNVTLREDRIYAEFEKAPSVCLKWLFTFNLAVKKVVISEHNAHVEFTGSRFIKSRDFEVR